MADIVVRPIWVRFLVFKRKTRNEVLIQCWFMLVAAGLSLPAGLLPYRWAWVGPAVIATTAAGEWLAFFWIDRHRAWPRDAI